jgi:hypothetical protein
MMAPLSRKGKKEERRIHVDSKMMTNEIPIKDSHEDCSSLLAR